MAVQLWLRVEPGLEARHVDDDLELLVGQGHHHLGHTMAGVGDEHVDRGAGRADLLYLNVLVHGPVATFYETLLHISQFPLV